MLYLLPTFLSKNPRNPLYLPSILEEITPTLDGLIAESEKEGRHFLSRFPLKVKPHQLPIAILNAKSKDSDIPFLLEPIKEGQTWGLVADAGVPCIADPGSKLVFNAKKEKIEVRAIPGPSSILLGLMLSGLPSQRFAFHGYLPKETAPKEKRIKELENQSLAEQSTQVLIEAPHRNQATFDSLIRVLSPDTLLTVAQDILGSEEFAETRRVSVWRRKELELPKSPALFLFYRKK